jgi:hypothetical protein
MLGIPGSALYRHQPHAQLTAAAPAEPELLVRVKYFIEQHPTYGYCWIWAWLHFSDGCMINRKNVYRLLHVQRWMAHQQWPDLLRERAVSRCHTFPSPSLLSIALIHASDGLGLNHLQSLGRTSFGEPRRKW